jgi:hypothetical protein
VFGGMLAASILGIFLIPGLYRLLQDLREKAHRAVGNPLPGTGEGTSSPSAH